MTHPPAGVDPNQPHPYGAQPGRSPFLFLLFTLLYFLWLAFIAVMSWFYPAV